MSIRKNRKAVVNESTLDFPRESLDKEVWARADGSQEEEEFTLAPEAESKVKAIVDFLVNAADIPDCSVNIVGSITSNSYTDDSDIDLHFSSPTVKDAEGMNERLRYMFDDQFKSANSEEAWHIGTHPVEVYFQANPLQDLMSVGCYSFTHKKWLVGPELTEEGFNPYSEYFSKDMKYVNKIIGDIRDMVLQVYERALVFNKLGDEEKAAQLEEIKAMLKRAAQLFENARKMRKHLSSPKSEEEAKKLRNDKKWKVADSAFKLMDKFGYLAILREYSKLAEDEDTVDVDAIVNVVRDNIGPANKKLHEIDTDQSRPRVKRAKVWIDDIREVPEGYIWFKSTDDFISFVEQNGWQSLEVVDIDHDAGDYASRGGDYIRCLDYLEFIGAKGIKVRIHSANAVGIQNMRRIIKKNGWTETYDIISESVELPNGRISTPNYDRAFSEIKKMVDASGDKLLGVKDQLNRGNKCIKLWHGEVTRDEYGIPDYSQCDLAWDPNESWGIAEVQTFPNHQDLTPTEADEAIAKAKKFIASHPKQVVESEVKVSTKDMSPEEYAQHLLHKLGADPSYKPKKTYDAVLNSIAHEYVLQMPTDTAAREVEMDAVLLLVLSKDEDAVKAGKKLGDIVLTGKGGDKSLLKAMQEAYFALRDLSNGSMVYDASLLDSTPPDAEDAETKDDPAEIDESAGQLMSLAAIAGMLAIPGVVDADTLHDKLKSVPRKEMRAGSSAVKAAISASSSSKKKAGPMNESNTINAVARTIYAEAKSEEEEGQDAIGSVILNRAGGDASRLISVISKPLQFSCWNNYSGGWTDGTYINTVPLSSWLPSNRPIWDYCVKIATKLVHGEFKSTIGNYNSYLNKATADKKNVDSWGKECKFKLGKHHFGYFAYNDGWKSSKKKDVAKAKTTYTIKPGDSLSTIAKSYGVSVDSIAKQNGITNPDKIRVGQKITIG